MLFMSPLSLSRKLQQQHLQHLNKYVHHYYLPLMTVMGRNSDLSAAHMGTYVCVYISFICVVERYERMYYTFLNDE